MERSCQTSVTGKSFSHDQYCARRSSVWTIAFIVSYGIGLFVFIVHHELSRDEVRAYSIARAAGDPIDLVRNKLMNEGHPPLWYLILWLGSRAWDDYAILKISSFLVALSLACLVCLASPFPLLYRCLLVLGVFPFYYLFI